MLRNLILLAILAFAVPTMTGQQKQTGQQDARKSQRDAKQADVPAPPITNNQATSYYEQPRENKPQGWHKFVAWPEGITAWAIMLTLGAIIWQAKETRKAAVAAQTSVSLANANIQTLKDIERSWILEEIIFPDFFPEQPDCGDFLLLSVGFKFTNKGKTPCKIVDVSVRFHTYVPKDGLPKQPQLLGHAVGTDPRFVGRILAPGDVTDIGVLLEGQPNLDSEAVYSLRHHFTVLCAYGEIRYETLGDERRTRFGYVWYIPRGFTTSGDKEGFRKGCPPAYNEVT
jgi:hypothetical protein